jgi:N-sulfoglucosamine sulfohydrolase
VISVAAEALYNLGEREAAKKALLSVLKNGNEFARCYALNVIDCIEESSPEIKKAVVKFYSSGDPDARNKYDMRAAWGLINKWGLDPDSLTI